MARALGAGFAAAPRVVPLGLIDLSGSEKLYWGWQETLIFTTPHPVSQLGPRSLQLGITPGTRDVAMITRQFLSDSKRYLQTGLAETLGIWPVQMFFSSLGLNAFPEVVV